MRFLFGIARRGQLGILGFEGRGYGFGSVGVFGIGGIQSEIGAWRGWLAQLIPQSKIGRHWFWRYWGSRRFLRGNLYGPQPALTPCRAYGRTWGTGRAKNISRRTLSGSPGVGVAVHLAFNREDQQMEGRRVGRRCRVLDSGTSSTHRFPATSSVSFGLSERQLFLSSCVTTPGNGTMSRDQSPLPVFPDTVEGIGEVTLLEDCLCKGVIDGKYFFQKDSFISEITKGSKVQFSARLSSESPCQWEVTSLNLYESPEDLEKAYRRKFINIIGKVIKFDTDGATVKYGKSHDEDVQTVPLACLPTDYEVWVGDYLILKIELNDPDGDDTGGKIHSVEPTNKKKIIGRVMFNRGQCSIDNYIYFDQRVCARGRFPKALDTVCVIAVESQQERFTWRAISVQPSGFNKYANATPGTDAWVSASCSAPLRDLMNDKGRIKIEPKCVIFPDASIGSSVIGSLMIQNTSEVPVVLEDAIVKGDQAVCKFRVELEQGGSIIKTMINPHATVNLKITCFPEMLGSTREMLVLIFDTFEIGRQLAVTAVPSGTELLKKLTINERNRGDFDPNASGSSDAYNQLVTDVDRPVVRGPQAIRAPFFMQKRMDHNPVPKYMWSILEQQDDKELYRRHPGALEDLRIQNYLDKFRTALWLEEMENHAIRTQYDLKKVIMRYSGDYLAFEVPGLKDIHPPLLVGDPISALDLTDPKETRYEGYVQDIHGEDVYGKFDDQFTRSYRRTPVTIRFLLGRTTYKRSHYAIDQAVRHLGEDWLFPTGPIPCKLARIPFYEGDSDSGEDEFNNSNTKTDDGAVVKKSTGNTSSSKVKEPKLGGRSINRRVASMRCPFQSDTQGPSGDEMKLSWFNRSLNLQQKDAVCRILRGQCRPLPYIVYGPPGTGKTVTVVEAIIQVNKLDKNSRILVVTPSNSAADVIAAYLVASDQYVIGDFIRLVGFLRSEAQIPESIRDYCKDGEFLDAVARHRLIVCTCTTAGQFFQLGLDTGHFTHVFIDEAGYCTEPEALIGASLVALSKSGQVILAGDPKQLGPVLMSEAAGNCGLSVSLLERFMALPLYSRDETTFPKDKYNPILLTKLVKNYRAHPTLLKLPSKLFYDDELEPAAATESINVCESLDFLNFNGSPTPLLFHGIQGVCTRDLNCPSWYNTAEVIQVVDYVRMCRTNGIPSQNIGIITPYRKQVEKLRIILELGLLTDDIPKVGSVEEFQGGERQVMIMSLVRSATKRELEKVVDRMAFVFSPKRFNVAVTRAKGVLIVLGNPHVLVQDPIWRSFLKYCFELGCYTGCDLPQGLRQQYFDHGDGDEW